MTPFTRPPSPPPAPCSLRHHTPGRAVIFGAGLDRVRGVVVGHIGERRWITVRLSDGSTTSMPCGGVASA